MVVETPPRGSTEQLDHAELEALIEALIEEARRRARRRRLRNAAFVIVLGLAASAAYIGFGRDGHGGTLGSPDPVAVVLPMHSGRWSPARGPDGGPVYAFAAAPNIVYAATATGVFRRGRTWTRAGLDGKQIMSVAVDPQRPSTVFAARLEFVDSVLVQEGYRSTNGGRTWVRLPVQARQIVVGDSHTLYAVGGTLGKTAANHLFRSSDGGTSWQRADAGLPSEYAWALVPDPADAQTVYVAADGIFKSTDGGATWNRVGDETGASALALDRDILYAATAHGFVASTDGGTTWQTRSATMKGDRGIVALTLTPGRIVASTYCAGVYTSADGGHTWRAANAGLPTHCPFTTSRVAVTPRGLLVGLERGAFTSRDGTRWTAANAGLSLTTVQWMAAPDAHTLFASAGTLGLFASSDGGRHWQPAPTGLEEAKAVAANGDLALVAGTGARVRASTDGGRTWHEATAGLGGKRVLSLVLDGSTAYAGTAADGLFSGDGRTWHPLGPAKTQVAAIAIAGGTIYAGSYANDKRGLYRSTDGGATWTRLDREDIVGLAATSDAVFIATANGVFSSTDSGATWRPRDAGLPRLRMRLTWPNGAVTHRIGPDWLTSLALDPATGRLYVGTFHNGVYTSANGGASWHRLDAGLRIMHIRSLQLDPTGRTLYAGLEGGGVVSLRVR